MNHGEDVPQRAALGLPADRGADINRTREGFHMRCPPELSKEHLELRASHLTSPTNGLEIRIRRARGVVLSRNWATWWGSSMVSAIFHSTSAG